jgi:hypothetical protein
LTATAKLAGIVQGVVVQIAKAAFTPSPPNKEVTSEGSLSPRPCKTDGDKRREGVKLTIRKKGVCGDIEKEAIVQGVVVQIAKAETN